MPSYFIGCTTNGVIVSSQPLDYTFVYRNRQNGLFKRNIVFPILKRIEKKVRIKGEERNIISGVENIKIGFFSFNNPISLGLELGDEIPVSITEKLVNENKNNIIYFPEEWNVCWATPD